MSRIFLDEIARQLSFSRKMVRNYVSNLISKLQVADQSQAIVKARQAGLKVSLINTTIFHHEKVEYRGIILL